MKRLSLFFVAISLITTGYGQTIDLYFPYFAGEPYLVSIYQGNTIDSISSGRLNSQGRGKITLPERLKGYRGVVLWSLKNAGSLDIIVADTTSFSISCAAKQPAPTNIIYKNSTENSYFVNRYNQQSKIIDKINALNMVYAAYASEPGNELLPLLQSELAKQSDAYNMLQQETNINSLYAARLARIVDMAAGYPPILKANSYTGENFINQFILNQLNFNDLYTSGKWDNLLNPFFGWYTQSEQTKILFVSDATRILSKISSESVYAAFAEDLIALCEAQNWLQEEIELGLFMTKDNRIKNPQGRVETLYNLLKIRPGATAPSLEQGELPKQKTILLFYETGCGNCEKEIAQLKATYFQLKAKGYEVVSISSDSDEAIFNSSASTMPWKGKYFSKLGIGSPDFINYAIMATPTIYLIDEKGIIQGRYASFGEIEELTTLSNSRP